MKRPELRKELTQSQAIVSRLFKTAFFRAKIMKTILYR
ncbi:hypothetical protein vBKpnSCarvaje_0042 [Klebsiella phage vB_KpnS-Carvaje]|uniref:Uncharacterized protein n=1 Tax=Klebsiella phage vB_KpnS-Carvaje TaxID=2900314 RepID=A0AAE8ZAN5_9CAUD|nr:hypothetical protein PQD67_gp099 [Klebsiella phage vB_KpnS-Carvaje]UJQ44006.1 hypothetical protein vBKpnSCarvaje_0042 [Klebsiella phage vB_KpnS-Carvaje]